MTREVASIHIVHARGSADAGAVPLVGDQVLQHCQEVGHGLAVTSLAAFDAAQGYARLRDLIRLAHELSEPTAAQVARPPHTDGCADRSVDIVSPERQRGTTHAGVDLRSKARASLALPLTHIRNDTPEGGAEPLPQTPTQRPTGARLL
jgi:hypothetical protein